MNKAKRGRKFLEEFIKEGGWKSREDLNKGAFSDEQFDEVWLLDEEGLMIDSPVLLPKKEITIYTLIHDRWYPETVTARVDEENNVAYYEEE